MRVGRPVSAQALALVLVLAPVFVLGTGVAGAQTLTDCRIPGLRHSVQCGVTQRALDPARPDGPKIDVHFVVVPAMARRKLPDPVFLLAGGPGQSAIDLAPQMMPLFSRLNNRRDIVFVDQRGTGKSAALYCPDTKRERLAERADPAARIAQVIECKSALLAKPFIRSPDDLGFFTTTIAVQDLDAVRRRLGAAQVNLVGVSYGTRVALEYMRQFPSAVRRAVLDSVAPPDMILPASSSADSQAALDAMLSACEREPECSAAHPRLRGEWAALLASLPKPAISPHPLSGAPEHFTLTREMVLTAVRGALYNPAMAAALPAAISAAAAGRHEGIVGLGSLLGSRRGLQLAMGMHFSVVCAEDVPRLESAGDRPSADFGDTQALLYRQVCDAWPRGTVPSAFYAIAPSRTPTLLLAGGLDPATPPRHAARVAQALGPTARLVVVPNAGHSVLGIGCARDVLYRFIDATDDAAAGAVDAGCLTSIPRPGVFRPIVATPGSTP